MTEIEPPVITSSSGGGGVTSLNTKTGALSLTTTGATLTVTPTGSTIDLEINLAHANTWTAVQKVPSVYSDGGLITSNGSGQLSAPSFRGTSEYTLVTDIYWNFISSPNGTGANWSVRDSTESYTIFQVNGDMNGQPNSVFTLYNELDDGTLGNQLISGETNYTLQDGSSPTNPATVAGWVHIQIQGTDAWLPFYQ